MAARAGLRKAVSQALRSWPGDAKANLRRAYLLALTAVVIFAVSGATPTPALAGGQTTSGYSAGDGPLRWSPPQLRDPITVDVPVGYFSASYPTDRDVLFVMPKTVRHSTISIHGGRNLRLIGGSTTLTTNVGTAVIRFTGATGSVFIAGTVINVNGHQDDAIDVAGSTAPPYVLFPDVYVQQSRLTGIRTDFVHNHGDLFQLQGSVGHLYIDSLTGSSNYQGIFIPPQFPISSADLSRINLGYESGGDPVTYLLWLLAVRPGSGSVSYPSRVADFWIAPRTGQAVQRDAVAPWSGIKNARGQAIGAFVTSSGAVAWPSIDRVTGEVSVGRPPQGDFVPVGSVGIGYVLPGQR